VNILILHIKIGTWPQNTRQVENWQRSLMFSHLGSCYWNS